MPTSGWTAQCVVFDMYGTLVDAGAVAEACRGVVPDPVAFNDQWRAKQLEYTFLRTLIERYESFWRVTEEALEFAIERFALHLSAEQRRQLMDAWLLPTPYAEVAATLARLEETHTLMVLSNGTPEMLQGGLEHAGILSHFQHVLSADSVNVYKPSPRVYQLAVEHAGLSKDEILFVSSNSWDALGARSFGFQVCWVNRSGAPMDTLGLMPDRVIKSLDELIANG